MQLDRIMRMQKPENLLVCLFFSFFNINFISRYIILSSSIFFSLGLDGKVDRDANGKEIRYPVILSNYEKRIARKIVLAFRVRHHLVISF